MATAIKDPKLDRRLIINTRINRKPVNLDSIEAMTPETDRLVTGTFINIECPGQPAKICGSYYKGMLYFSRVFDDGEKCTIPLSVARWIKERCFHIQHKQMIDEKGLPVKENKKVNRYQFTAEF